MSGLQLVWNDWASECWHLLDAGTGICARAYHGYTLRSNALMNMHFENALYEYAFYKYSLMCILRVQY